MNGCVLIPISPGELLDKIAILRIKVRRIGDLGKVEHVQRELGFLEHAWERTELVSDVDVSRDIQALADLNARIWDIEDGVRNCEATGRFDDHFIFLARQVYVTNDERARIKQRINVALGSSIMEQKSYQAY